MEGNKDEMKESSKLFRLNLRKEKIQQKVWHNRMKHPSSMHLPLSRILVEEEKEEPLESPKEGFLPLYQYKRYFPRRKRGKKCWICGSWKHLKKRCPKMNCFHCGRQGLFKTLDAELSSVFGIHLPFAGAGEDSAHMDLRHGADDRDKV